MDRIYAPWRIEWVTDEDRNADVDDCVFCELPERDARTARVVARSAHAYVVFNVSPYSPGHTLVVPDRHTGAYRELPDAELVDHAALHRRTTRATRTAFDADGSNSGMNVGSAAAGGSVPDHVHTHVVPRYRGDTTHTPDTSDHAVVDRATDAAYDALRDAFRRQADARLPDPDGPVVLDLALDDAG